MQRIAWSGSGPRGNGRRRSYGRRIPVAIVALLAVEGCATTGSTLGGGVGDAHFERPPYYAGARSVGAGVSMAHLPVTYQRGAAQEAIFDPKGSPGTPVDRLVGEMNLFLDSLLAATPIVIGDLARTTPPDVRFGCEPTEFDECGPADAHVARHGRQRMRLAVGRPSSSWVATIGPALDAAGADRLLVITLEVGEYWVHQKNLRGSKEVRLGTGHTVGVPWLTSLDQPVQVLQLTGAVVDRDGTALRIGAEGMLARRTNLLLSGLGAQALIGDEDVERLRSSRRDDLPGTPLLWQAALATLVSQLLGDPTIATW